MDNQQECTAVENALGERPNPLFVPDCVCAACSAREARQRQEAVAGRSTEEWLRASGRRQRTRVHTMSLGAFGRSALG